MSTQNRSQYLLLFRGANWQRSLSPEEIQKVMIQWIGWFDWLKRQGKLGDARPLEGEGEIVSAKSGATVDDGDIVQGNDDITGYSLLQVSTLGEAVEIARQCPVLDYGSTIEVRKVAAMND